MKKSDDQASEICEISVGSGLSSVSVAMKASDAFVQKLQVPCSVRHFDQKHFICQILLVPFFPYGLGTESSRRGQGARRVVGAGLTIGAC